MSKTPSIFHSYGTLTGFFGPPGRIDEALLKQLRPVSTWRKWNARDLMLSNGIGFQPASEIKDGIRLHNSDNNPGSSSSVRYITYPGTPKRNLSPVKIETVTCTSLPNLQNLEPFPGLTIIEDAVLIPCLKDDEPDMIGSLLRKMANSTGGIIVLGKAWVPPISDLDQYFDRVVWVYEMPMMNIQHISKTVTLNCGQATFND